MRLIEVNVLKEWIENWFTKNRLYHPYAKNNNIPITELYDILEQMPSAQPEIIHCGECKHRDPEDHKCDCGHDILWQLPRDDKWYCADAGRRTDESD